MNLNKKAQIDNIILGRPIVESIINPEWLVEHKHLKIDTNKDARCYTNDGKTAFSSLCINQEDGALFNQFRAWNYGKRQTSNLTITPSKGEYGNLQGYSSEELKDCVRKIKSKLKDEYYIDASFPEAEILIKKIELNKTIELNQKFNLYDRSIRLLLHSTNFSRVNEGIEYYDKGDKSDEHTGYCVTSGPEGQSIVFYDKAKSILKKKKKLVDANLLRFEIKMFGRIEDKLHVKVANLENLTDEVINKAFFTFLDDSIIKNYYRDKEFRLQIIRDKAEEARNNGRISIHKFVGSILNYETDIEEEKRYPLALDVDEILEALHYKNRQEKSWYKKRITKVCVETYTTFTHGDGAKVKEILDGLMDGGAEYVKDLR